MRIDLPPFEIWEQLNATVASELKVSNETSVRCYPGLAAAIFELAQGTAQFYSHKKSIALVPGQTPHLQAVLPYFYKEGYDIQMAPVTDSFTEWVHSLKKDTCFVILSEDHPVTGELHNVADMEKVLNEKKIFCLRVSHSNHLYRDIEVQPYSIRICSYNPQVAVALLGSKMKAPSLIASYLEWEKEKFLQSLKKGRFEAKENRSVIENFESNLPAGYSPLLTNSNRCYDRSLIYTQEAGGESLQQFLASALKIQLQKPGWETLLETTHLCRWGGTRNYELWWNLRPEESILRGLLILSTEILEHPELGATLEKALRECQIADLS